MSFTVGYVVRGELQNNKPNERPELERLATLLINDGTLKEISEFTKSKVSLLREATFNKLCSKMEELRVDDIINESDNNLKVRISTLSEKEIDLKKLQAEGFMETLNTIKKMCR